VTVAAEETGGWVIMAEEFRTDLAWTEALDHARWCRRGGMTQGGCCIVVESYILIQTEVGKASTVAKETAKIAGVLRADDVTGPYDVVVLAEAENVDLLGQFVVRRIQSVDGITRTLTCPIINF
jgi:DNA-binding Lrp family transcriptional regulator